MQLHFNIQLHEEFNSIVDIDSLQFKNIPMYTTFRLSSLEQECVYTTKICISFHNISFCSVQKQTLFLKCFNV